ncbi:hypothetical protein ACFOUV_12820 [Oceanobacillus longus]|uniref:Uncharacterized protein n=1 Tax=Oceanobacillus longus TaxID=930120 RepID=A0ABV8GXP9_9BACI
MEYTLISISLFIVIYFSIKVDKLDGRIKGMQYTLDQLAKRSGISENPINDDLRKLIKDGKDINIARETLGLSLVEGKEYIDKLKFDNG